MWNWLAAEELHSEQSEDEDEEKEQKQERDDRSHAAQQWNDKIAQRRPVSTPTRQNTARSLFYKHTSDVDRGQTPEDKAEDEEKTPRPRPRPRTVFF